MTNEYNIAIYLRISEEDDLPIESQSILSQRNLINDFLDSHPELSQSKRIEFCDDGYTGTNFDRPEENKCLSILKQGIYTVLS